MKTDELQETARRVLDVDDSRIQLLQRLSERNMVPSLVEHSALLAVCNVKEHRRQLLIDAHLEQLNEDVEKLVSEFFELDPATRTVRWTSLMNRTSVHPTSIQRINLLQAGLDVENVDITNDNPIRTQLATDIREVFLAPIQVKANEERRRVEQLRETYELSDVRSEMMRMLGDRSDYCQLADSFCDRVAKVQPRPATVAIGKSFGGHTVQQATQYDTASSGGSRIGIGVVVFLVMIGLKIAVGVGRYSTSQSPSPQPYQFRQNYSNGRYGGIQDWKGNSSGISIPWDSNGDYRSDTQSMRSGISDAVSASDRIHEMMEKHRQESAKRMEEHAEQMKAIMESTKMQFESNIESTDQMSRIIRNGLQGTTSFQSIPKPPPPPGLEPIDRNDPKWQTTYDLAVTKMNQLREADPRQLFLKTATDAQLMSLIMTQSDAFKKMLDNEESTELIDELFKLGHLIGHEPHSDTRIIVYPQAEQTTP